MPKSASRTVSRSSVIKRLWALLVLALLVGGIAYPPAANAVIDHVNDLFGAHIGHVEKGFVLGLDLQGGTHLEYEADVSKVADADRSGALNGVKDVIERRVNSIGVSEPLVTTAQAGSSWRVSVELAGIRDINQAIKLIGETPILEFKEQNTTPTQTDLTADQKKQMADANASSTKMAEDALAQAKKDPSKMEELVKQLSQDDATKSLGGDLGWIKDRPEYGQIYNAANGVATGTIINKVIETDTAYAVAKVEERDTREVRASHILIQYAGAVNAPASTTMTKDQAKALIEQIKKEATPKNFADLAKKDSQEPGADQSGGDLGWFGKGMMVQTFEDAVFKLKTGEISDVVETPFGFHLIYKSDERPAQADYVRVRAIIFKKTTAADFAAAQDQWKSTQLTGKNLKRAQLDFDQRSGNAQVSLLFDDEGTKLFADITKRNVGKPVAIFLDGQAISTPVVQTEITGGQAVITGNFTVEESKLLAQRLQAGALPVPIKLIAQQSVGPTLGQDSINKSVVAGLWGFLFVALFMLFWYRLPGLLSILALTLYVGISGAIFKMLPVTLTLSGIAGFILSLGIAVDANVLIFERLKEELKAGKPYMLALEEAFRRAWPSIRDGNTTTLISCFVLWWFSSSVIKGFALTLAIGIIVSLFTAIVVTRTFLRFVIGTGIAEKMRWFFLNSSKH